MIGIDNIDSIFQALDRQIVVHSGRPIGLVVCGGTALAILGLVTRTTKDVDVLGEALRDKDKIIIRPLHRMPEWLDVSARVVQRDYGLPDGWLNTDPSSQVEAGLPEGLESRLVERTYGTHLTLYFLGRVDQIYFKLYASIDSGPASYHVKDLFALQPTGEELEQAVRWCLVQDVSQVFKGLAQDFLRRHGHGDIVGRL
jgi:hypothetical protein